MEGTVLTVGGSAWSGSRGSFQRPCMRHVFASVWVSSGSMVTFERIYNSAEKSY